MQKFTTKTGFGYLENQNGHITDKCDLPPGEHLLKDGFLFIEVNNREELDQVIIYQDPAEIEKMENRDKVDSEIRRAAIETLIQSGELPPDYTEL